MLIKATWKAYRRAIQGGVFATVLASVNALLPHESFLKRFGPITVTAVVLPLVLGLYVYLQRTRREQKARKGIEPCALGKSHTFTIHEDGAVNSAKTAYLRNDGRNAFNEIIEEKYAITCIDRLPDNPPNLQWTRNPSGRTFQEIYAYSYPVEVPQSTGVRPEEKIYYFCWGIRIEPPVEPGEEVEYQYELMPSGQNEKDAFSKFGTRIIQKVDKYYEYCVVAIKGPPLYRVQFERPLAITASGETDWSETRWIRKMCPPEVDQYDDSRFVWKIVCPIPRMNYTLPYRFIKKA